MNTFEQSPPPLGAAPPIAGLDGVIVTSATFGGGFGCVTTRGGDVQCFGSNYYGELGASIADEKHEAPLLLPSLKGAKHVAAGEWHACAILADGRVSCWGRNDAGQTGSSTSYLSGARELIEPRVVDGIRDVSEIAVGEDATCALSHGQMWCWGRALFPEQLAPTNERPTLIRDFAHASSLTTNGRAFCAIKDSATVACWGYIDKLVARGGSRANIDLHVRALRIGGEHACGVDDVGRVLCFGTMPGHALSPPAPVEGIPKAVDVLSGYETSCAITISNEVWCWGRLDSSIQGDAGIYTPIRVNVL
jgi:alpha-tubulin suppressor-like RCC1 family protein